jgi:3-dehydroquinate synthase
MAVYTVEAPPVRYPVLVERGVLARTGQHLPPVKGRIFVLTTPDVWAIYGDRVAASLGGREHSVLFHQGGEPAKRLNEVERLAGEMVEAGGDRSSAVVALGGGIVTDVGGFLAGIFMRGIPYLSIPTTLLAQVDAAIGGKTGVNLEAGKNLVGVFHQPHTVLMDPEVLDSLPDREYRAGLYEVIKHGIIRDADLFDVLDRRRQEVLARDPALVDERVVGDSVRIKAEVVAADEKEGDLRRILNYGHTFGHALEAATRYSHLLHGEAVAFGMRAAAHLGRMMGLITPPEEERMVRVIREYGPIPDTSHLDPDLLMGLLKNDKKTVGGVIHFVLPVAIGRVKVVTDVDPDAVRQAIAQALRG